MSDPTDFLLATSASFTKDGVAGLVGNAQLAFEAKVVVNRVVLAEDGTAPQLEHANGGVITLEPTLVAIASPTITCSNDANGDGVITLDEYTNPVTLQMSIPTGVIIGSTWNMNLVFTPASNTLNAMALPLTGSVTAGDIANGYISQFVDVSAIYPTGTLNVIGTYLVNGSRSAAGTYSVQLNIALGAPTIVFPQDTNMDGTISAAEFGNPLLVNLMLPSGVISGDSWTMNAYQFGTFSGIVQLADITNGYVQVEVNILLPFDAPSISYTGDVGGHIPFQAFTSPLIANVILPAGVYTGNTMPFHVVDQNGTVVYDTTYTLTDQDVANGSVSFNVPGLHGTTLTTTCEVNQVGTTGVLATQTEIIDVVPVLGAFNITFPQDSNSNGILTPTEFTTGILVARASLPANIQAGNTVTWTTWLTPYQQPRPNLSTDPGSVASTAVVTITSQMITQGYVEYTQTSTLGRAWNASAVFTNTASTVDASGGLDIPPVTYSSMPYPVDFTEYMDSASLPVSGSFHIAPTTTEFVDTTTGVVSGSLIVTTSYGSETMAPEYVDNQAGVVSGSFTVTTSYGSTAMAAEYVDHSAGVVGGSLTLQNLYTTINPEYVDTAAGVVSGTFG